MGDPAGSMLLLPPFELLEPLARGGMAEVWTGRHAELDLPVAVKVVDARKAKDEQFVRLFADEARAVASLDHPGVVWVHEYGLLPPSAAFEGKLVAGSPYLVMELGAGTTLADWRAPSWPALRSFLLQMLGALAHVHARGVIHRDLKPANVLNFGGSAGDPEWKLTDFGIAWLGVERNSERRGLAVGSPSTMAPEQAMAEWRDLGPHTDLYALGCIAWWLATGVQPFKRESTRATMQAQVNDPPPPFRPLFDVPPGLRPWLQNVLEKRPVDRTSSAADALAELLRLDPEARPAGPPRRRPSHLVGAGLGLYGLRPVPLVARREERKTVQASFGQVAAGRGALLVALEGDAGMGKSRLARWAAERGIEEGLSEVVQVTHGATPGPGDGLAGAIARHTRTVGLERRARIKRLERLLGPILHGSPREGRALAELIQPSTAQERSDDGLAVELGSAGARHAIARRYLEWLALKRPVLLVIDDLHRSPDTAAFLQTLLAWQDTRPARILVVATVRSDVPAPRELDQLLDHPRARSLEFGPLSDLELAELVERQLLLDKALVARVVQRAEGNPMFAVQLVGDWVARGVLRPTRGGWRLAKGERATIPDDLRALWLGRVDAVLEGLDPADGRAIEVAAVLGQDFGMPEWLSACRQLGLMARPDPLSALADSRLLERTDDGWRFSHGLLVEALVQRASDAGRAVELHTAAARSLLADARSPEREKRLRIATHLLGARRPAEALALLEGIAAELESLGEPDLLSTVLDALERAIEASDGDEPARARVSLRVHQARLSLFQARLDDARSSVLEALRAARQGGWTDLELRALLQATIVALVGGQPAEAERFASEGLVFAEASGDRWRRARLLHRMATAVNHQGRAEQAVELFEEARRGYREVGDAYLEAYMLGGLAHALLILGRLDEAESVLRESVASNTRLGQPMRTGDAFVLLGEIARQRGDRDAARSAYEEGTRLYRDSGNWIGLPSVLANLAVVAMEDDQPRRAEPLLEEARSILRGSPQVAMGTFLGLLRLCNASLLDDWEPAERELEDLERQARERELVNPDTARALAELGDRAVLGRRALARRAWTLAGWMYGRLGRPVEAEALAEKAR